MKAILLNGYGDNSKLSISEIPRPKPGAGEVLVKLKASSVNPLDWKVRSGYLQTLLKLKLPQAIGWDLAGVVEELGDSDSNLKIGDEVYSMPNITSDSQGTFSQYAVVKNDELALKPKSISFNEAAAIPLAALTAWQALFDYGELKAGQSVLIHAGAGGVGHLAIQFAKLARAKVIATASKRNREFLIELGADQVIDYKSAKFEEILQNVDLVLDSIGGESQLKSIQVLKTEGKLVTLVGLSAEAQDYADSKHIKSVHMLVKSSPENLDEITKLIDDKKIHVHIESTFKLEDLAAAFTQSEAGRVRGKLVIQI